MSLRLRPLAIVLSTTALFAWPARAATPPATKPVVTKSSTTMRKAIWGPLMLNGSSAFPTYKNLGAGIYEMPLSWRETAPARPAAPSSPTDAAYRWPAELDTAVAEAAKYHMQLLVRVYSTPGWANGDRQATWVPDDPADLATFMATASKRYPSVKYWDVWEETTRRGSFLPLTPETKRGSPLNAQQAMAPHLYAKMLDASYSALKAVDRTDVVLGGNSFTAGDLSPKNFIANLRLPDGRPPRMDMYAHNPFSGRKPNIAKPPLPGGFADISDADTLARWIDKNLMRPGQKKKIPLFFTEFTLPTDHPNHLFNFYVSRRTQADWTTAALRLARGYKRVAALGWFTLLDEPTNDKGNEARLGLLDAAGERKPAFAAFAHG